jgi:hypothetical protein
MREFMALLMIAACQWAVPGQDNRVLNRIGDAPQFGLVAESEPFIGNNHRKRVSTDVQNHSVLSGASLPFTISNPNIYRTYIAGAREKSGELASTRKA